MNGAGVNIVFPNTKSGELAGRFSGYRARDTNDAAVTRYFNDDCFGMRSQRTPTAVIFKPPPADCATQNTQPSNQENFQFKLPPLSAPDYAGARTKPPDRERLQSQVTTALKEELRHQPADCKTAFVTISYYSREDPEVYVYVNYVDAGRACEMFSGMLILRPSLDGGWEKPGKLWSTSPPNDWSYTVARIKHLTLVHYRVSQ